MNDDDQGDRGPRRVDVDGDLVAGDKHVTNNYTEVADERIAEAEAHGVDLRQYLLDLHEDVGTIKIPGIRTRAGEAVPAEPIEQLYTPLRSKERRLRGVSLDDYCRGDEDSEDESEPERITLAELLREHRHLLLVGQPGAGKSTFSNLIASMLARDLIEPREGAADEPAPPWRTEHLGLPPDRPPPVPALIRIRELVGALLDEESCGDSRRPNNWGWILRLLASRTQPTVAHVDHGHDVRVAQWQSWLDTADGEGALLILDGLDEAANTAVHERVVKIIRSACRQWSRCRIVVTSRPFGAHGGASSRTRGTCEASCGMTRGRVGGTAGGGASRGAGESS